MKFLLIFLSLVFILQPVVYAENKIPPEVRRVLEQISKIKAGDTLGSFLADAKIKAEAKQIYGVSGHKCFFLTWTFEGSGKWLLWTSSRSVPVEDDGRLGKNRSLRRDDGELVSVSIYYRENTAEALDFQRHKRQVPYFPGRKVHTQLEAEQTGTGQPATRPESKSEGSDKPQPESEGHSRQRVARP